MIIREERIGGQRLILGDCMSVVPLLGAVQHVITDPPYSDNTHKMAKSNKGAGYGKKFITFGSLSSLGFDAVADACLTAADGWVVMTCDYTHASQLYDRPEFVRLGAWVKPNPMPQISADRPGQGFETIAIMHAGKVRKKWNRGGGAGVWTYPVHSGAQVPTQKPLGLISAFVSDFTQVGEMVLDPFMGSGTTLVACEQQGRLGIGIEANLEHFEVACERVRQATRQPDLFVQQAAAPTQGGFDL